MGVLFQEYYGGGDTIRFYEEATEIVSLDWEMFLQALTHEISWTEQIRAIYFVRIVAVMKFLTGADYWILSVYFSMFSFLGCFYFSDQLSQWNEKLKMPAVFGFLYFPSIVFWSSGLLKESLAFGALSIILGCYVYWFKLRSFSIRVVLLATLGLIILVSLKYYIAAVLFPLLMYIFLYHQPLWNRHELGFWTRTCIIAGLLIIPAIFFFSWLSPNLSYERFWQILIENHQSYLNLTPSGSVQLLHWFDNELNVIMNIPYLWFSGIFRPFLGEHLSFPAVFSGVENLALLIGTISAIIQWYKEQKKCSVEVVALLLYVSTLSVFLSFAAPNFGTLARFKIYYAPFVLMFIVYQLQSLSFFKKN